MNRHANKDASQSNISKFEITYNLFNAVIMAFIPFWLFRVTITEIYTYFPTYFQLKWLYLSLWELEYIKDNIVLNGINSYIIIIRHNGLF